MNSIQAAIPAVSPLWWAKIRQENPHDRVDFLEKLCSWLPIYGQEHRKWLSCWYEIATSRRFLTMAHRRRSPAVPVSAFVVPSCAITVGGGNTPFPGRTSAGSYLTGLLSSCPRWGTHPLTASSPSRADMSANSVARDIRPDRFRHGTACISDANALRAGRGCLALVAVGRAQMHGLNPCALAVWSVRYFQNRATSRSQV